MSKPQSNSMRWLLVGTASAAITALLAWGVIAYWPLLAGAFRQGGQQQLRAYLHAAGVKGVLLLYLLQTLQIFSAFFPSMTIQIAGGITYGVVSGMLICLAGIVTGNAIIFAAVRRFGPRVAALLGETRYHDRFAFLKRSKNVGLLLFGILLVPGFPNGIMPYLAAGTNITFARYLLVVTLASVPNILFCTYLGDRIIRGEYVQALVVLAAVLAAALVVYLLRNRIFERLRQK
ncbi:MAG: VTT domain-containing protein [Eubacteriales bacterium]|nr:VTT domain-containing protein [Eubacteriales bacterium]